MDKGLNFKLVVVNSLLELHPSFEADLAALKNSIWILTEVRTSTVF